MLYRGTNAELASGDADYVLGDTTIKFRYDIEEDDIIAISHITTAFSTGKPFITHTADSSMNNSLVLTGGDGITIGPVQGSTLYVNNTGLLQRTKETFTNLSHVTNVFTFVFSGSYDFGTSNHDDNRIDIFVDGLLKEKDQDYEFVSDGGGGFQNDKINWIGGSTPTTNARFTIIIF